METENGKLYIPDGTVVILEESFMERDDIEELYLPDSVEVLGPGAFCQCTNLKKVRMSKNIKEIGDGAFLGSPFLTEIEFPYGLERIGDMAFWESGLTCVYIPETVKEIGESAFWECESLRKADVLGKDVKLGTDCFGSCPNLLEGYIATGFPEENYPPSNLLFTLLWASCPEKHTEKTCIRASEFVKSNEKLVLEYIIKEKNIAALRGICSEKLFSPETLKEGVQLSVENGYTELAAAFLNAQSEEDNKEENEAKDSFADFEL